MSRRTKREMELMRDDAKYYLLQTSNNPHKAWDLFIKEHLENQLSMPYYIKSIKDFISVSETLNTLFNRNNTSVSDTKEPDYIDQIKEVITEEKIKSILRPLFRSIENKEWKMTLVDLMNLAYTGELDSKHFTENDKRNLKKMNVLELLSTEEEAVSVEVVTKENEQSDNEVTNNTVTSNKTLQLDLQLFSSSVINEETKSSIQPHVIYNDSVFEFGKCKHLQLELWLTLNRIRL